MQALPEGAALGFWYAVEFDVKELRHIPRDTLERELEERRDEYDAVSDILEQAGVPEIVVRRRGGNVVYRRALAWRLRKVLEKRAIVMWFTTLFWILATCAAWWCGVRMASNGALP